MSFWKLSFLLKKKRGWVSLVQFENQKPINLTRVAKKLGQEHKLASTKRSRASRQMTDRFRTNYRQISSSFQNLARKKKNQLLTPTERWLFENQTIIRETAKNVYKNLTPQLLSRLPSIKSLPSKIRVFEVIISLISHSDHRLNYHRLNKFIFDYQTEMSLTIAELWAIPLVAQAILIDTISNTFLAGSENENTAKNIVLGLINIQKIDWNVFVEDMSFMEKILRHDPAGIYSSMDFRTRDIYRHNIEEIHFQSGHDQNELAQWVVSQAKKFHPDPGLYPKNHVGYYLLGSGRAEIEQIFIPKRKLADNISLLLRQHPVKIYFLILWGITLFILSIGVLFSFPIFFWPLIFFPSFYLANLITHQIIVGLYRPSYLPKMDPEMAITERDRTMVLVPTILLPNSKRQANLLAKLEENFLANRDSNIFFGIAVAWPETTQRDGKPSEEELDSLESLKVGITALNHKYPHVNSYFHLFFRDRIWNPSQESWVEWERKRGKVMEFVRLLRGATDTTFSFITAPSQFLSTIRYVITIDDDITTPRDAAKKLIATISHPLNRPIIDRANRTVTSGYGIIQPRLSTQMMAGNKTLPDYLFADDSGWDSYNPIASSTYQDVFRESFFLGRGIFDVDVFDQVLSHRFPENTLLSHDHIEGFYCRTGFASDIQIFETYPQSYFAYYSRLHRWVRGDWQRFSWILPWVKDEQGRTTVNPLSFPQRWKLTDDMIQNLTLPASIILALAFLLIPPRNQTLGIIIFLTVTIVQPTLSFLESIPISKSSFSVWGHYLTYLQEKVKVYLSKTTFNVVFSFHQSLIICHAIAVALSRIFITKKRLLEWEIFSQTNMKINEDPINKIRQILLAEIGPIIILFSVYLFLPSHLRMMPTILASFWLSAPLAMVMISQIPHPKKVFSEEEERFLRIIARKTWRFFDDLVTAHTNFLPPDHFQQTTPEPVSVRTSATDLGMYLVSIISSLDLGFITLTDLLDRCQKTLSTMNRLDLLNGHFFNWYDVKTLKVLPPGYVSTVDSGNLACGLLTLHQGLKELSTSPLAGQKTMRTIDDLFFLAKQESDPSLSDRLNHVQEKLHQSSLTTLTEWYNSLTAASAKVKRIREDFAANPDEVLYWITKLTQFLDSHSQQILFFAPWVSELGPKNSLLDRCQTPLELNEQYNQFKKVRTTDRTIRLGLTRTIRFLKKSHQLSLNTRSLALNMDFSFLYDRKQDLFWIGYSLSRKAYDRGHYDLLASEVRMTSLFAIAKYDVPLKHWSLLSRPMSLYNHRAVLLSWGGSIFEYLLPSLFLPNYSQTLLWETYQTVIQGHIDYGVANKIPWGVSESSYGLTNKDGHFRYKLHGVPGFGLKQSTNKDLVVSPYSVFLAMEFVPDRAYQNILRLEKEGLSGKFGLFEAIDYTNYEPVELGDRVIRTFLCHHQSIILIAIANMLNDFSVRNRFSSFEPVLAHLTLLQEKIPSNASFAVPQNLPETNVSEEQPVKPEPTPTTIDIVKPVQRTTQFNLLSNGRYKIFITDRGTGFSMYQWLQLTRWQNDPVLGQLGNYIYLKDVSSQKIWSAAMTPTAAIPEKYGVSATEGTTKISRTNWEIETSLEIAVVPDEDMEVRLLTMTNHSPNRRTLEITSYSEIVLDDPRSDQSHPTFSKMRLEHELVDTSPPILLFHRPSTPTGDKPTLACSVVQGSAFSKIGIEVDRQRFLGRAGSRAVPQEIISPGGLHGTTNFSLDQIACFQTKISLAPGAKNCVCFLQTIATSKEAALGCITKYNSIDTIKGAIRLAEARRIPDFFGVVNHKTLQQLLTCLIIGRNLYQSGLSYNQIKKLLRVKQEINWYLPTITILATPTTDSGFLHQILNLCYLLSYQGLSFKIFIIAFDRDNYYQLTSNLVQDIVNGFETLVVNNNLVSPDITILRSYNLSKSAVRFITATSSIVLNGNKKSTVGQQIGLAFDRL